jgi:3D (Asp-Asp-Asp) domain-containing protein
MRSCALVVGLWVAAALALRSELPPETQLPDVVDRRDGAIFRPQAAPLPLLHRVTAYCPCPLCCGAWADGYTASGRHARQGRTAAADPSVWKIGTCLEVPGVGQRIVEDTGSGMIGRRLDIYFESHEEALRFGVKLLPLERC